MGTRITDQWSFTNTIQFLGSVVFGGEVIGNANVKTGANVSADKLSNRIAINYGQDTGSDVVSATKVVHVCRAAGTVKSVEVRPLTAPTGGDKQFTVDVKKAVDGSGTFSSLLSAVVTVDNTAPDQTREQGSLITTPSVADGDAIQIVVTASGSTGSQGQGVQITINIDENGA